jgi:hypothetical protein
MRYPPGRYDGAPGSIENERLADVLFNRHARRLLLPKAGWVGLDLGILVGLVTVTFVGITLGATGITQRFSTRLIGTAQERC